MNVSGKCSGVFVDGCKKTAVFTDTTMAGVEVVNSQRINLYINTSSPSVAIDKTDGADALKTLQKVPLLASFAGELLALFAMKPVDSGSIDITGVPESDPAFMY